MKDSIYSIHKTNTYPLGSEYTSSGIRFSGVFSDTAICGVLIYLEDTNFPLKVIFPEWTRHGRIYSMEIVFSNPDVCRDKNIKYLFFEGDRIFPDPYMQAGDGFGSFGNKGSVFSVINRDNYCSLNKKPVIDNKDRLFYMLHVRGYTAHTSSKTRFKGTFKGLCNKLEYIAQLGVSSLILMPVYEFDEVVSNNISIADDEMGINFWGYTSGYYYKPKSSYTYSNDPVREFHELVDGIHAKGMEVILQFAFTQEMSYRQITDILRFWKESYDVDGFQIIGTGNYINEIISDPLLTDSIILYDHSLTNQSAEINQNTFHVDIDFMRNMRCFLKGDPNYAHIASDYFKVSDPVRKPIVFMARQDTMRMADIVTYNEKHNEANGEGGRDGADVNFSWNCGFEGPTRKKAVCELRQKQYKNALSFALLSEGYPLIYGGDEFGNTQFGNNNPYNQDNEIGYIKWPRNLDNNEIYNYTRKLIAVRLGNPAIGTGKLLTGRDVLSKGYPDVSLHGQALWAPDLGPMSHCFGVLYYNLYADPDTDSLIYIICNMNWEKQEVAIPNIKGKNTWNMTLTSDDKNTLGEAMINVEPRSIAILECSIC